MNAMINNKSLGKRKHYSQITEQEQMLILEKFKKIKDDEWVLSQHVLERVMQKNIRIKKDDLVSTIYNSNIIEYRIVHNKTRNSIDERVILRSKAVVNRHFNLHVVYSITTKRIVTAWCNHVSDLHNTLDMSIYSEDMEVLQS